VTSAAIECPDPSSLLDLAVATARAAAELVARGRASAGAAVQVKSSPVDVVTAVDTACEELIVGRLLAARPDDGLLGEEGSSREGTSGVRWVVDPLDGTVNYLYGLPSWAVSIAAEFEGETVIGVVEAPTRGETFRAALGHGAFRNAQPIRCRPAPPLDQALVGTGFNYVAERRAAQADLVRQLIPRVRDIRRSGSAAVDLCDVAAGRLDAFYERGLHAWDLAAGDLIAREAGARTGGRPGLAPDGELAVAASPGVFDILQPLLDRLGAWHD
jgi:myo-inositol-1(or 4)-monophosphatase